MRNAWRSLLAALLCLLLLAGCAAPEAENAAATPEPEGMEFSGGSVLRDESIRSLLICAVSYDRDGYSLLTSLHVLVRNADGEIDLITIPKDTRVLMQHYGEDGASYTGNLKRLGVSDPDDPEAINLFPKDFEAKDRIADRIAEYNKSLPEDAQLAYTDYIGLMISSITTIINAISYILIAFVAVSLVVSSIMIGIITYISVLERTREIGVLRSIGASRRDIGFAAGSIGIGITLLLILPLNAIIHHLSGLSGVAALPAGAAVILVAISMLLTFLAGLIPSRIAAKKDPVIALRSE